MSILEYVKKNIIYDMKEIEEIFEKKETEGENIDEIIENMNNLDINHEILLIMKKYNINFTEQQILKMISKMKKTYYLTQYETIILVTEEMTEKIIEELINNNLLVTDYFDKYNIKYNRIIKTLHYYRMQDSIKYRKTGKIGKNDK